jgi:hypothetical protein
MIYILIAALWVVYGAFSMVQDKEEWRGSDGDTNEIGKFLFYMILAPIILVVKALYGIFRTYNDKH